jgi:hypothetical protein
MEFWAIPKVVVGLDISLGAKMVFGVLFTRKNGENVAWPSRQYIADIVKCSLPSVDRYITELKGAGVVAVQQRGLRQSNVYTITLPESSHAVPDSSETYTLDSSGQMTPTVREQYKRTIVASSDAKVVFKREEYRAVAEHFSKEYQRVYKVPNPPAINFAAANKLIKGHFARGVTVQQINKVITSFLEELRWNDSTIKPAPDLMVILSAKHFNRYMTKK